MIKVSFFIIRKTKRFAFFERTAHFFRTKRTSEGYPPISKIFRLAHASIILKRRWNFIPTPFVFRFVASLRFTRFRRSLCTMPRFALPRFFRGRRDATRCTCTYSMSRNSRARTTHRHTSTRWRSSGKPHGSLWGSGRYNRDNVNLQNRLQVLL